MFAFGYRETKAMQDADSLGSRTLSVRGAEPFN